jgi:hypothetical protein
MSCDHPHQGICDYSQTRHHCKIAKEVADSMLHPAVGIRGDPPHLEGSISKTDSGLSPTVDLGVHHQYPGNGNLA